VTPTAAYWLVLLTGMTGLLSVLFRIVTGNVAAVTLLVVIMLGIVLFNAGSALAGKSQKKMLKSLSYYR
jgi:hypothetical protein